MANLGNVGFQPATYRIHSGLPFYGLNKRVTPVTMTATSETPGAFILLFRNGVLNDRTRADASSGVWSFYDMDDSLSQDYTIISLTQSGPTGEEWKAVVSGATATVTKLFSSQRAVVAAFT